MDESFEKTYPHQPFAGLIGLGIAVAGLLTQTSEKNAAPRLPKGTTPAAHSNHGAKAIQPTPESVFAAVAAAAAGGRRHDPGLHRAAFQVFDIRDRHLDEAGRRCPAPLPDDFR